MVATGTGVDGMADDGPTGTGVVPDDEFEP